MADIHYTEPICPKCKKETMKEWVHEYKCRGLNCRLKIKKIFPPDPGSVKSYKRITKLEQEIKELKVFVPNDPDIALKAIAKSAEGLFVNPLENRK